MTRLWGERRFRLLLNLIDHLPTDSYYTEAKATDKELAAAVLDQGEPPEGKPTRRVSEWSPVVELLTGLSNDVKELTRVTLAVNRNKPPKLPLAPYPTTAIAELRSKRKREYQQDLRASLRFAPDPPT